MLPTIAIVGRLNVGKSTLFNCLTKSRDALVADVPGLTRDRQYGQGRYKEHCFIVIDSGGIVEQPGDVEVLITQQSLQAVAEADVICFVVDAKAGLTPTDTDIMVQLRQASKPIILAVNKIDGLEVTSACGDFYTLGTSSVHPISALQGRGVTQLISAILAQTPEQTLPKEIEQETGIRLAIVGRPNVGKSTLVNRLLGEDRVIVFDKPGTTRDSIFIPFNRNGQHYIIIDTAGVRRRSRIKDKAEKFSIVKTLQAISAAHVVVVLLNAKENVVEQDLRLIGFVLEAGKSIVIAINKWDGMERSDKLQVRQEANRRLSFVSFAKCLYISALHGTEVGSIITAVQQAYQAATKKLQTPQLTSILEDATAQHSLPRVSGKQIKLRYAHAGGHNPPTIVIHGKRVQFIRDAYKRYLMRYFRDALHLTGTPIRIKFKSE